MYVKTFSSIVLVVVVCTFSQQGQCANEPSGTIVFSSLAPRGWDLYITDVATGTTRRLTTHPALDYNAKFTPDGKRITFVSERNGNLELYGIDLGGKSLKRITNEFAMDDHPAWSPDGKRLAFVSTRQAAKRPGHSWNAIYVISNEFPRMSVSRVTPQGAADYSPAWSPKGDLIAFASGSGKVGASDIFVMKPDGGGRRRIVKNGGWPAFSADGKAIYFHRKKKGVWGIWRVAIDGKGPERISSDKQDVYTPSSAAMAPLLAVAVKRGKHRQIALLNLETSKLNFLTKDATDHWNPSVSPDGRYVVYHKMAPSFLSANVELWDSPAPKLQMVRTRGAFPTFSPDGKHLTLTGDNFSRLNVMNVDGSQRKTIYKSKPRSIFSLSWAHGANIIAFSLAWFQSEAETHLTLGGVPDNDPLDGPSGHAPNPWHAKHDHNDQFSA